MLQPFFYSKSVFTFKVQFNILHLFITLLLRDSRTIDKLVIIDSAVNNLNYRLNNVLADLSHCYSSTLSTLSNYYYINVSGCPLSTFDSKHINTFLPHGEKQYEEFRKSLSEVITNLYI